MNIRYRPRLQPDRRDTFWLVAALVVLILLAILQLESPGGFSGPGTSVWKSSTLDSDPLHDTLSRLKPDSVFLQHAHLLRLNADGTSGNTVR